jgi:hypothetical protein
VRAGGFGAARTYGDKRAARLAVPGLGGRGPLPCAELLRNCQYGAADLGGWADQVTGLGGTGPYLYELKIDRLAIDLVYREGAARGRALPLGPFPFDLLQPPCGTGDRVRTPRRPLSGASIRSLIVTRPIVPAAFRKLDAVAVLTGPSLPATRPSRRPHWRRYGGVPLGR